MSNPIEPIRKQITVAAPQERAFRVFTENMTAWWPKDHHIGKTALKHVGFEDHVGERWFEVCEDGTECNWGKVLELEHRNLERFGENAEKTREALDRGWALPLPDYARVAAG